MKSNLVAAKWLDFGHVSQGIVKQSCFCSFFLSHSLSVFFFFLEMYNMFAHCYIFFFPQSPAHNLLQSYLLEQNVVLFSPWFELSVHEAQRFNFIFPYLFTWGQYDPRDWGHSANASTFQYKVEEEKSNTGMKAQCGLNRVLRVTQRRDNKSGKMRTDMHFWF